MKLAFGEYPYVVLSKKGKSDTNRTKPWLEQAWQNSPTSGYVNKDNRRVWKYEENMTKQDTPESNQDNEPIRTRHTKHRKHSITWGSQGITCQNKKHELRSRHVVINDKTWCLK